MRTLLLEESPLGDLPRWDLRGAARRGPCRYDGRTAFWGMGCRSARLIRDVREGMAILSLDDRDLLYDPCRRSALFSRSQREAEIWCNTPRRGACRGSMEWPVLLARVIFSLFREL